MPLGGVQLFLYSCSLRVFRELPVFLMCPKCQYTFVHSKDQSLNELITPVGHPRATGVSPGSYCDVILTYLNTGCPHGDLMPRPYLAVLTRVGILNVSFIIGPFGPILIYYMCSLVCSLAILPEVAYFYIPLERSFEYLSNRIWKITYFYLFLYFLLL